MSDTGKFKSSQAAAQKNSAAISAAVAVGGVSSAVKIIKTNLSVVENIHEMETQLSSCNTEFKQLVANDADSILNLSDFFTDFDSEVAWTMCNKVVVRNKNEKE